MHSCHILIFSSEHNDRCCQEVDGDSCGSSTAASPEMDRNPSPPPEEDETEAGEEADAIGETVYSKHWLFSTLTRLIQVSQSLACIMSVIKNDILCNYILICTLINL